MKSKHQLLVVLITILCTITACKKKEATEAVSEEIEEITQEVLVDENGDPILLGVQERAALENDPYTRWFDIGYKEHTLDTITINTIKEDLGRTKITLFMGTWCEDSQREVPALYKILDLASYKPSHLKLITVSEDKDTPQGLEKGKNITNVPTIIIEKKGKELGRIVEYPIESLEKDLAKILSGEDYKHAYEE